MRRRRISLLDIGLDSNFDAAICPDMDKFRYVYIVADGHFFRTMYSQRVFQLAIASSFLKRSN